MPRAEFSSRVRIRPPSISTTPTCGALAGASREVTRAAVSGRLALLAPRGLRTRLCHCQVLAPPVHKLLPQKNSANWLANLAASCSLFAILGSSSGVTNISQTTNYPPTSGFTTPVSLLTEKRQQKRTGKAVCTRQRSTGQNWAMPVRGIAVRFGDSRCDQPGSG